MAEECSNLAVGWPFELAPALTANGHPNTTPPGFDARVATLFNRIAQWVNRERGPVALLVVAVALLASLVSAYPLPHPLSPQIPWTLGEEVPAVVIASGPERWVEGWPRTGITWLALGAPLPTLPDEVDLVARPAVAMPLRPAGFELRMALDEGDTRLERWRKTAAGKPAEKASSAVSSRLIDHLADARISVIGPDGAEQRCAPFVFGRANCGKQPWEYVGKEQVKVAGRNETCIWAHPLPNSVLRISFPLPASPGLFTGRAGFADSAVGQGRSGEVTIRVTVAGEPVAELKRERVSGFATLRGTLPARSTAGRLLIDVEGSTAAAHFCFDGDLRPASPLAKDIQPPAAPAGAAAAGDPFRNLAPNPAKGDATKGAKPSAKRPAKPDASPTKPARKP